MSNTKQNNLPEGIKLGWSILLLGPGLAIIGVAIALLLLTISIFLFVSFSGILAIGFVIAGLFLILGSLILWPVKKHAKAILIGALSAITSAVVSHYQKKKQ